MPWDMNRPDPLLGSPALDMPAWITDYTLSDALSGKLQPKQVRVGTSSIVACSPSCYRYDNSFVVWTWSMCLHFVQDITPWRITSSINCLVNVNIRQIVLLRRVVYGQQRCLYGITPLQDVPIRPSERAK